MGSGSMASHVCTSVAKCTSWYKKYHHQRKLQVQVQVRPLCKLQRVKTTLGTIGAERSNKLQLAQVSHIVALILIAKFNLTSSTQLLKIFNGRTFCPEGLCRLLKLLFNCLHFCKQLTKAFGSKRPAK